jgi:hypothetical protein
MVLTNDPLQQLDRCFAGICLATLPAIKGSLRISTQFTKLLDTQSSQGTKLGKLG